MLIDRTGLRSALVGFRGDLERFRVRLNHINTLPVPDHDTGDNLLATISQVLAAPETGYYDAFGNSGLLISAWLEGAQSTLAAALPIGQLTWAAAREVAVTIASPRPGLFLDYALRSASLLADVTMGAPHDRAEIAADDLRILLIETAQESAELRQLVDSGSAGLYFLLKRLLRVSPNLADDYLFEATAPRAGRVRTDGDLVEFLFTVPGATRDQVRAALDRLAVNSVIVGRGPSGGIRVHCHGPRHLTASLCESMLPLGGADGIRVRYIFT